MHRSRTWRLAAWHSMDVLVRSVDGKAAGQQSAARRYGPLPGHFLDALDQTHDFLAGRIAGAPGPDSSLR